MPRRDVTGRLLELPDVDLHRFFRPSTIAVIGASERPGRPTTAIWRRLRAWGDARGAQVWPVNPKFEQLDGVPCAPTEDDVPGPVDVAAILVGDPVGPFEEAQAAGVRFAVIFGAGFAEAGKAGAAAQRRLEELAAAGPTRLVGPNTNLNAFELFRDDLDGPALALVTQSGHQGRPIVAMQELGVRVSHWAPTGNEADLEVADFVAHFAAQPEVGAIAAYVEGFRDGRAFALAADRAAVAGTPLVCVKVGRTDEGRSMAVSHTGHLTGTDRVVDGVFRQFGVTRVDGLDELADVSTALARSRPPADPKRRNVAVYAISGGTGAHMADLCAAAGLRLPTLGAATQAALREHVGEHLRVSNPVDSGGGPSVDPRSPTCSCPARRCPSTTRSRCSPPMASP